MVDTLIGCLVIALGVIIGLAYAVTRKDDEIEYLRRNQRPESAADEQFRKEMLKRFMG